MSNRLIVALRSLMSPADSAYTPAGVRLVMPRPRLPPSRNRWRHIHNRYELWMGGASILAVWISSLHALPDALPGVLFYTLYTVLGKLAYRWRGIDSLRSTRYHTLGTFLNLLVAAAVLFLVYSHSRSETIPQAAGLWLVLVLASLPAARYLDTRMTLISTALGGLALTAATLAPLLRPGVTPDVWEGIVPSLIANVLWLAALSLILRVSLVTLAAREQGFADALITLSNVGVDQASMRAICGEAVRRIARRGLYEYVLVILYDEECVAPGDEALEIVAVAGRPPEGLVGYRYSVERGITGRAVSERAPQLVNDVDLDAEQRFLAHARLPNVRAECAVPIVLGERVIGVLDVESTQPGVFEHEDIDLLQMFASQLALVLERAQQMEFQHSLRKAMQQILSMGNVQSMMEELANLANRVLNADSTILYLSEPAKEVWYGPFWRGDIGDPQAYQRHDPDTDSLLRWLIVWPEPVFAHNPDDLRRLWQHICPTPDVSQSVFTTRRQAQSLVAAPLRAGVAPVGVMFVNYRRERKLGRAFREMANAFFDVAGIAALNCHLHNQARSAGRQDALADVHDGLSQIINYQIRTRIQQLNEEPWLSEHAGARQAVSEIERALATAADLVRRLKDRSDASQPMSEMLNGIARNLYGIDPIVTCQIQPAARADHHAVRGWMAQELNFILLQAVNNAVQHAQATTIQVDMCLADSCLRLSVTDDGHGFEPDQIPSHRGLYNIRQRATKIGGTLNIDTAVGRGTSVTLDVPLHVLLSPSSVRREGSVS
jgi:signal transduction histidine kinase